MNKYFIVYHCNISHLFESINIYIYGSKIHIKKCIAFNDLMIFLLYQYSVKSKRMIPWI